MPDSTTTISTMTTTTTTTTSNKENAVLLTSDEDINDCSELVMLVAGNDEASWRALVFDKFKQILDELKSLQSNPIQNVCI